MQPALKGDGSGNYRILLLGNTGTGKSTLAKTLSMITGFEVLHLDQIAFEKNELGFKQVPEERFRSNVKSFQLHSQSSSGGGGIIDGNHPKVLGGMNHAWATDIIWLDPPFVLYFPRVLWRTLLRLFHIGEPALDGCWETWWDVLCLSSKSNSIIHWCWTNHDRVLKRLTGEMEVDVREQGNETTKWQRIGGWGSELDRWIRRVEHQFGKTKRS